MRFFHLSDLHIGAKLINRDLRVDQEYVFSQVVQYAGKYRPDAILVAGDIYDKAVPSSESVAVFDRFICALTEAAPDTEIMMISGNHDSAPRLNAFRSILSRQRIHMIGLPPADPEEHMEKVTLQDPFGPVNFYLMPFVKPSMVRQITGTNADGSSLSYSAAVHALLEREEVDREERNVLVSHQFYVPAGTDAFAVERMDSEIRTVGNIDEICSDVLRRFDYAALGHIHKPTVLDSERYRYCGTPLAYSVSEAEQSKGIVMVEMKEKGEVSVNVLPLEPLHPVRVLQGELSQVLRQGSEDYVTVILTDRVDLDVIDMQDRIRSAFPNLLEIRREAIRTVDYSAEMTPETERDPFALCSLFLKDMDEQESELLRDVINTVLGVK